MIIEDRYGNNVNAEEFAVEVKRGYLYCGQDRSNLLYLIGRSTYIDKEGRERHTSEVLMREPFSKNQLEEMLDLKDQLKAKQERINHQALQLAGGSFDAVRLRQIKLEQGWALREADE